MNTTINMKKFSSILTLSAVLVTTNIWTIPVAFATSKALPIAIASTNAAAPTPNLLPEISATAYLVKDLQSNQILAEKSPGQPIEPASLTQLMTAYLAFKALESGQLKPNQMLTVSERGWKTEGSRMFLEPQKPVSVSDLVKGLIIQSGNDAAVTLAEAISGNEEAFVALMNAEAKRLGMQHTHFDNATGLPSATHLSTMNDLAVLSHAIIYDFPQYYAIFSKKSFTYNNITQQNRNLLLFRDPSVDGLKAGYTNSAGYNLIASSKRNNRRVISIVVGTASPEARATESSKLLNYALQSFETPKIYGSNQVIMNVRVYKGSSSSVELGFLQDLYLTVEHGRAKHIKPILETMQPIIAPVKRGQELGTLKLMDGNHVLAERKVVALKTVESAGFLGKFLDSIALWIQSLLIH